MAFYNYANSTDLTNATLTGMLSNINASLFGKPWSELTVSSMYNM